MHSRNHVALGLAACLLAAATPALADEGSVGAEALDSSRAIVVSVVEGEEASGMTARFAETLVSALVRETEAAGFQTAREPLEGAQASVAGSEAAEPDLSRAVASSSGARWVIVARSRVEGSRILWRASFYDGASGGLMGADAFSAYAGLSALSLIEGSAKKTVQSAMLTISEAESTTPIDYRIELKSSDDGAAVSIGDVLMGEIADGSLEAPYFPFVVGGTVAIESRKEGYWPRRQVMNIAADGKPIVLKPLFRKTKIAFGGNYGTGRMLGLAGSFRWYPLSDLIYLRAEDSLWAAYDFSAGARPVLHDELRIGAGAYPLFDPAAKFRASVGLCASVIGTFLTSADARPRFGLDVCVEPLFLTLEWHGPTWAIVFESRFPYSVGASTGFLPREWLSVNNSGPIFFSVGILFKR